MFWPGLLPAAIDALGLDGADAPLDGGLLRCLDTGFLPLDLRGWIAVLLATGIPRLSRVPGADCSRPLSSPRKPRMTKSNSACNPSKRLRMIFFLAENGDPARMPETSADFANRAFRRRGFEGGGPKVLTCRKPDTYREFFDFRPAERHAHFAPGGQGRGCPKSGACVFVRKFRGFREQGYPSAVDSKAAVRKS